MKKTATLYYIVWTNDTGKTVRAGKVTCDYSDPKGVTNKALQEAKKAAKIYCHEHGGELGYCVGGYSTTIADKARTFMEDTDKALLGRIKKPVSDLVKQLTVEGMERYGLDLYDAFKSAASTAADKRTMLYKAWYKDDFREYIPSAYIPEYLNFEKYPLAY